MGIVTLLFGIPALVFSGFLVRDLYACTGHFQRWILRSACKLLPLDQRNEKYDQWHADLLAIAPSEILRTLYALDCVRAAAVLSMGPDFVYAAFKRFLDLLLAGAAIALAVPALIFSAVAIYIETRGSILFSQTRYGLGGRPFRLLKFRVSNTQSHECDEQPESFTLVGGYISQLALDELPQFINVIRGEMSLVGPRPISKVYAEYLSDNCPGFELRYNVKPGITGWAQVNSYPKNSHRTPEEAQKQALLDDLYYVRNCSARLDLLILLKTVGIVLRTPLRK